MDSSEAPAPRFAPVDPARSRVVLIGTITGRDPALAGPPQVADDVMDLRAYFTDRGFDHASCVVVPPDAGPAAVAAVLAENAAAAQDLLLVYYVGHALIDPQAGRLYLALAETRAGSPATGSLPFDTIRTACAGSEARNRTIVLDCDYRGSRDGAPLPDDELYETVMDQLTVAGTRTLASSPMVRKLAAAGEEQHTPMTGQLLTALREEGTGLTVNVGELQTLLAARSKSAGQPAPQLRGSQSADRGASSALLPQLAVDSAPVQDAVNALLAQTSGSSAEVAARSADEVARSADPVVEAAREGLRAEFQAAMAQASDATIDKLDSTLQRLVPRYAKAFGAADPATFELRLTAALIAEEARGGPKGARSQFASLVKDLTRAVGPTDAVTLLARRLQGENAAKANRPADAVAIYEPLLAAVEQVHGQVSEQYAFALLGLATSRAQLADPAAGCRMLAVAVEAVADQLDSDVRVFAARRLFATLLAYDGDYDSAATYYQTLQNDARAALGGGHDEYYAIVGAGLGVIAEAGKASEAIAELRNFVPAATERLGARHETTLLARYRLAQAIGRTGDWTEALGQHGKVVSELARVLGSEHRATIAAEINQAELVGESGRIDKAASSLRGLASRAERAFGKESRVALRTRRLHADHLLHSDQVGKAAKLLRPLLADDARVLGADSGETIEVRVLMAVAVGYSGKYEEGRQQLRVVADDKPHLADRLNAAWRQLAEREAQDKAKGK